MDYKAINFAETFPLLQEQWAPRVVADMNDSQIKIVKLEGDFIWHEHVDSNEAFVVLGSILRIDFRDGAVELSAEEIFVVPKGVVHKPFAGREALVMLIEPRGLPNTGSAGGERTAVNDVWI